MFFGTVERPPRLSEFDFEIPEKLIAQHPSKKREDCKLMVVHKDSGKIEHKKFKDVADFFNHFAPYGHWKAKLKEHSEEDPYCGRDDTVRMEIFVDIKKDDPIVKSWMDYDKERENENSG